jgi:prolyl oligopeptidase
VRKAFILFFPICFFRGAFAQYLYLPTKTVDSSDTYFGVTYKDPYRWLEYLKEPEAIRWFKQQSVYTDSLLQNLNGQDELISEWKQIDEQRPPIIGDEMFENGRVFYSRSTPGASAANIYYREGEIRDI